MGEKRLVCIPFTVKPCINKMNFTSRSLAGQLLPQKSCAQPYCCVKKQRPALPLPQAGSESCRVAESQFSKNAFLLRGERAEWAQREELGLPLPREGKTSSYLL